MHTGKGILKLSDGRRLPVEYQFGSDYDDTRAGYLICEASTIDPGSMCERLLIECDDGTEVVAAVMHSSERYLAITGRVLPAQAP
jgi:hypothetical protein